MNFSFPQPNDQEDIKDPLKDLDRFCVEFNDRYLGHFFGAIITTSELIGDNSSILHYSFWMDILKKSDYSFRIFEVTSEKWEGGYPVTVSAFNSPTQDFGRATKREELEKIINDILNSDRGKFIILSNY